MECGHGGVRPPGAYGTPPHPPATHHQQCVSHSLYYHLPMVGVVMVYIMAIIGRVPVTPLESEA